MKKTVRIVALVSTLVMALVSEVKAQETSVENHRTISVETDPSTFVFGGYALHVRVKPKKCTHLLLGAGTYALNMPSLMVNLNKENKGEDWEVRINSAFALFGEYYFKEANSKWFVGLQAGVQNYKIKNLRFTDASAKYSNLLLMPSIGYNWQPFKAPFYVKPWLGLGYTAKIEGENSIGAKNYDIAPILPFATLHLGYTFK